MKVLKFIKLYLLGLFTRGRYMLIRRNKDGISITKVDADLRLHDLESEYSTFLCLSEYTSDVANFVNIIKDMIYTAPLNNAITYILSKYPKYGEDLNLFNKDDVLTALSESFGDRIYDVLSTIHNSSVVRDFNGLIKSDEHNELSSHIINMCTDVTYIKYDIIKNIIHDFDFYGDSNLVSEDLIEDLKTHKLEFKFV